MESIVLSLGLLILMALLSQLSNTPSESRIIIVEHPDTATHSWFGVLFAILVILFVLALLQAG